MAVKTFTSQICVIAIVICSVTYVSGETWTSESAKLRLSSALANIRPQDPRGFRDETMQISRGPVNINMTFRQTVFWGLSQFTVNSLNAVDNPQRLEVTYAQTLPNVTITVNVQAKGTITYLKVDTVGDLRVDIANVYAAGPIRMTVAQDGRLRVEDVALDCTAQRFHLHFNNLNANSGYFARLANRALNRILNSVSGTIRDSMKPSLQLMLSTMLKDLLNAQLLST